MSDEDDYQPPFEDILRRYFELYNPAKLPQVPDTLRKYTGREDELLAALEKKYGKLPPEVADGGAAHAIQSTRTSLEDNIKQLSQTVGKNVRRSVATAGALGIEGLKAGLSLGADAVTAVAHFKPPEAVFGAAPSLAMMREINGRKTTFRGAWFWYYYRVYYPYVFPPLFLIFMIVALAGWNTIQGHLVLGSILSLVSSISVVVSYIMIQPWQKHPSKLVLYRALTSVVFSLNLIFEASQTDATSCRSYAVVTEVTLLGGECWLTTIALDLVYSLTNPFSSYKENMRRYQFMVWGFTGLLSFIFFFDNKCQGVFDKGVCWLQINNGTNSPCLWGYYLFWIIIMYIYQLLAALFAYQRLKKGLPASFEVRKRCAQETFKCLMVYALYLSVLMFFFTIIAGQHADTNPQPGSTMANFALFFLFIIANRGSVDGAVWFMLHDFARDDPPKKEDILAEVTGRKKKNTKGKRAKKTAADFEALQQQKDARDNDDASRMERGGGDDADEARVASGAEEGVEASDGKRSRAKSLDTMRDNMKDMRKNASKTFQELADLAIAEIDEADLSPQVNMALRQQIVQYVTRGVRDSIERKGLREPKDYDIRYYLDNILQDALNFETQDPAISPGLEVFDFTMDEHPFKTFAPAIFKQLRENEGISDEKYLEVLSSNTKERLSEGASGAFMIFCGGGEFIVKTIRAREARVLHDSMPAYAAYLAENKDSFLCRFLGSYSLKMYSQTFYFVVMLNCFDPKAEINERFDIKGSWVGRSAEKEKGNARTVCRHCNTYFVPSKKEKCDMIVGPHESNMVLKDNDLRVKISLQPAEYARVMVMLKKDSDLLGQLGVMDYSLLVGVMKRKFDVGDYNIEVRGRGGERNFYVERRRALDTHFLFILIFSSLVLSPPSPPPIRLRANVNAARRELFLLQLSPQQPLVLLCEQCHGSGRLPPRHR